MNVLNIYFVLSECLLNGASFPSDSITVSRRYLIDMWGFDWYRWPLVLEGRERREDLLS